MANEIEDSPFPALKPDIQEAWRVQDTIGKITPLLGQVKEGTPKGKVYQEFLRHMYTLRRVYTPELTGEELDLLEKIDPKQHKLYSRGVLDSFDVRANVDKLSLLEV